eukprot:1696162-Amphidinium_carterae.1
MRFTSKEYVWNSRSCWEEEYHETCKEAGFKAGVGNFFTFLQQGKDAIALVHGDDFVMVGDEDAQQDYLGHLK